MDARKFACRNQANTNSWAASGKGQVQLGAAPTIELVCTACFLQNKGELSGCFQGKDDLRADHVMARFEVTTQGDTRMLTAILFPLCRRNVTFALAPPSIRPRTTVSWSIEKVIRFPVDRLPDSCEPTGSKRNVFPVTERTYHATD